MSASSGEKWLFVGGGVSQAHPERHFGVQLPLITICAQVFCLDINWIRLKEQSAVYFSQLLLHHQPHHLVLNATLCEEACGASDGAGVALNATCSGATNKQHHAADAAVSVGLAGLICSQTCTQTSVCAKLQSNNYM